jgi:hypothetical protein
VLYAKLENAIKLKHNKKWRFIELEDWRKEWTLV